MKVRALSVLALVSVVSFSLSFLMTDFAHAISKKDVKKLVAEYCDADTKDERREKILRRLRRASPKTLADTIKKVMKSEDTREKSFDLAYELNVNTLFKEAKKYVDSALEAKAIRTVFISHDKKVDEFLFDRWKKTKEVQASSFEIVDAGMRTHWVGAGAIDLFHDYLTDKKTPADRAAEAEAILKHQMVLSDEEVKSLRTNWKPIYSNFLRKSRQFKIVGRELLGSTDWSEENLMTDIMEVTSFRDKKIIHPMGRLVITKLSWKNCTITFWVMPLVAESGQVGLGLKGMAFMGARLQGGMWTVDPSISQGAAPANAGQWHKIVIELKGKSKVTVDGIMLTDTADYGSVCQQVSINAGRSTFLVGAIEYLEHK